MLKILPVRTEKNCLLVTKTTTKTTTTMPAATTICYGTKELERRNLVHFQLCVNLFVSHVWKISYYFGANNLSCDGTQLATYGSCDGT